MRREPGWQLKGSKSLLCVLLCDPPEAFSEARAQKKVVYFEEVLGNVEWRRAMRNIQ